MKYHIVPTLVIATALIAIAIPADSAPSPALWQTENFTWSLGGSSSAFALRLTDDAAYGWASLGLGTGLAVADLTDLSFDAYYAAGSCGGGSPRVQLAVDTDGDEVRNGNIFVYAGPAGSFSGCPQGVWSSYDMFDGVARFDASQLGVGGWVKTYPDVLAALPAGSTILAATFVWDSAWLFPSYQVYIDNLQVNGAILNEPVQGEACSFVAITAGVPAC